MRSHQLEREGWPAPAPLHLQAQGQVPGNPDQLYQQSPGCPPGHSTSARATLARAAFCCMLTILFLGSTQKCDYAHPFSSQANRPLSCPVRPSLHAAGLWAARVIQHIHEHAGRAAAGGPVCLVCAGECHGHILPRAPTHTTAPGP